MTMRPENRLIPTYPVRYVDASMTTTGPWPAAELRAYRGDDRKLLNLLLEANNLEECARSLALSPDS